ncbi:MAG: glycosyltransferase family 4 protein [Chloroflexi bacterium]|nr:glycosyltransferase family 4 protein [Chloroflexota bacterium]
MTEYFGKTKIKILLVGPIPPPFGGIPAYVKSLYDAKLDHIEFSLFNTAIPSWVIPFHREGERSYSSLFKDSLWESLKKIFYVIYNFARFIWFLIVIRPSIVQVFTSSYWGYWRNWLFILIAKLFKRKTIFHLLGAIDLFYFEVGNFHKTILRRSLNSADINLLQSPGLEAWAKQYSKKEVFGIWNGIDFNLIQPKLISPPMPIGTFDGPIGLTVGNLSFNKGTLEIINALIILKEKNISINWVFIGRGDIQHYSNIADQNDLTKSVIFTGEITDSEKWQYFHHSSFYCLPSFAEGQPISIIEAMACGLPVISTKIGSIPEMITDDLNGKLIIPGKTQALSDAIQVFALDSKLRNAMGRASLDTCIERHNITDLYNQLSKIYFRIIAN